MKLLVVSLAFLSLIAVMQAKKIVVCYFGSWAVYRPGDGKFDVEQINPYLCSHAVFGFAGLGSDNKIRVLDTWNELDLGAYRRFNDLRKKNPELKTLIAIGGWNEGSETYSKMASDPSSRKTFVDSVVEFVDTHGFNGLDVDWEYPAQRGGVAVDKQNYITLLNELSAALKPKGHLLTAAVGAGKGSIDTSYDVPGMSKALDLINLMEYDFHGSWDDKVGHQSLLYGVPELSGDDGTFNVNFSVNYWISLGAPKEKLVMGMPLYGKSFTLRDATKTSLQSLASGGGNAGQYTRETGTLGYNEICVNLKNGGWTTVKVGAGKNPYSVKGNQWVGYDDLESIKIKSQYINDMGLAGGMVWSIETDDFQGACHGVKSPLLRAVNEVLNGGVTEPAPEVPAENGGDQEQTAAPPAPSTAAPPPPADGLCKEQGYVKDPSDPQVFYYCQQNGATWISYKYTCSNGLVFNQKAVACDYPANVV